jgi:archaellum biogenesis ATPase FlaH
MLREELNARSPMRVFERSMQGGLGRGNVGLVIAEAGVGKSALLVQIALDKLLRGSRVLHVSGEHAVDHVRAYYSEIFHDLSDASNLADAEAVKLEVETNRLIFSLMPQSSINPAADAGTIAALPRILDTVTFARDVAQFEPDVIIIDGFELVTGSGGALRRLTALARERNVELWLSARADATPGEDESLRAPLDRAAEQVDVVVLLAPDDRVIRLRLLKDHDNQDLAELRLRLEPHTMRVIDEDVTDTSARPRNARQFRLVSGGGIGAEAEFGACAERWGMTEVHYSFPDHNSLVRRRGVVVLGDRDLRKGDFSLIYASKRLGRELSDIPQVRRVLQTIWHQITNARQVFAVGVIQPDGTVRGGTGWGAELARFWKKPLLVFDQDRKAWFRWSGSGWELADQPMIVKETFAGIGTQHLTSEGREAIQALFRRSFGEPAGP